METITEAMLRSARLPEAGGEYRVRQGVFVTPQAKEYLALRGMAVVYEKPEGMTHLRAGVLVPKSHLRIALRGLLDALEARIISLQVLTHSEGLNGLTEDLEDALHYVRVILAAEVKESPLEPMRLFGLDQDRLRAISHDPSVMFGIGHPLPSYTFGAVAAGLNELRTQTRICELAAVRAFDAEQKKRPDIILALNRLSSGFYVLYCKSAAGHDMNKGGISLGSE